MTLIAILHLKRGEQDIDRAGDRAFDKPVRHTGIDQKPLILAGGVLKKFNDFQLPYRLGAITSRKKLDAEWRTIARWVEADLRS